MNTQKKKNEDSSFEDSLKKLESIVEELEKGELSLDEALKLYEQGMEFSDKCMKKLNESKQKVEKLTREGNNKYSAEPFSVQNKEEDEKS
jgi:exodeoxyribonuclease VII small subunit